MTYEMPAPAVAQDETERQAKDAAEQLRLQTQAAEDAAWRRKVFDEELQRALEDIAPALAGPALALEYLVQQVVGQQEQLWDQVSPLAIRVAQAESRARTTEDILKAQAPITVPTVHVLEPIFRRIRRILLLATSVAAVATAVLLVGHFVLATGWATTWAYVLAGVTGGLGLLLLTSHAAIVTIRRQPSPPPVGPDSAAGEADLAYAKSQVELAQTQLADALRTRAIEPMLRSLANEVLGPSYSTHLSVRYSPGLSEVFDARYEVSTEAARELSSVISMIKGGSIGLAGPRGSGKTTLIESVCEGRTKALPSKMVSLKVSAPVEYEPRDFILYLFSRVCREFTGVVGYARNRDYDKERSYRDQQEARIRRYVRQRIIYAAIVVGIVSMGLGVLQFVFPNALWMKGVSLIAAGVAILAVTYAVRIWASVALRRPRPEIDADRELVYSRLLTIASLVSITGRDQQCGLHRTRNISDPASHPCGEPWCSAHSNRCSDSVGNLRGPRFDQPA